MKLITILIILVLAATTALAYYNWQIFIVPHELSLGFASTNIPFGLTMLAILITVTALFLMNIIYLLSSSLLEFRRHTRELNIYKELADKAESSRVTELKNQFEEELSKHDVLNEKLKSEIIENIDQIETRFNVIFDQLENTLDAYIGEFEDRLERSKLTTPNGDNKL